MKYDILSTVPAFLRDFLTYSETIKGKSSKSIEEYYHDLLTFFRYIKLSKGLVAANDIAFEDILIDDIPVELLKTITLSDLFSFLVYCKNERGNNAATRARKASTLRIFFKYLTTQVHLLDINPAQELDTPKIKKALPVHLSLQECYDLLSCVDGDYKDRDYCILTIFLNCGLRLSELCSLNLSDIDFEDRSLSVLGKGNKERIIYLNDACIAAISDYLPHRPVDGVARTERNALFLSRLKKRISNKTIQHIVNKYLEKAGLADKGYSVHKLRHTAATLMYQHGGVDIRVLKEVLGHENIATTQIYTHVSDNQVRSAISANPLATVNKNKKK